MGLTQFKEGHEGEPGPSREGAEADGALVRQPLGYAQVSNGSLAGSDHHFGIGRRVFSQPLANVHAQRSSPVPRS